MTYVGAQLRCDECGAMMSDAGQSGWVCPTAGCPNAWGGGEQRETTENDDALMRALRREQRRRP